MKKVILLAICATFFAIAAISQVTRINRNNGLQHVASLKNAKMLFASAIDQRLWVSEGTFESTVKLNSTVGYQGEGIVFGHKYIFRGNSEGKGSELYITDGTASGTKLVKDIFDGSPGSVPADFTVFHDYVYFTAITQENGRELWRTNGTEAGTAMVKDILPDEPSSNKAGEFHMTSTEHFIFLTAASDEEGTELWRSDGTSQGTVLVKDINPGVAGSDINEFYLVGDVCFFTAYTAAYGREYWRTDGTEAGTFMLMDAKAGPGSANEIDRRKFKLDEFFHLFKNKVYFMANDGVNTNLYSTDGTAANTNLVKPVFVGLGYNECYAVNTLNNAINLPDKFVFVYQTDVWFSDCALWQSDGTAEGTFSFYQDLFLDISAPVILHELDSYSGTHTQRLFNGSQFFFTAEQGWDNEGYELWISDGTHAGTRMVKDIGPSGYSYCGILPCFFSYIFTSESLFFAANDGINGWELWQSDGTSEGTSMLADINPEGDAYPHFEAFNNGHIFLHAIDGNSPYVINDLYVMDGTFSILPVKFADFTLNRQGKDAVLRWTTLQELNTINFTVQRSLDAKTFKNISVVKAAGVTNTNNNYSFTDANIDAIANDYLYYRIVSRYADGSEEYSMIKSLKLNAGLWNVQLLGNTPGNSLRVIVTGKSANTIQITINDIAGKLLFSNKYANANAPITVPLQTLPQGIYLLTVTNGNEKKSVRFVH